MSTVTQVVGAASPLPSIGYNTQQPAAVIPVGGRIVIPPVPLPQTLIGSTTQTSYST